MEWRGTKKRIENESRTNEKSHFTHRGFTFTEVHIARHGGRRRNSLRGLRVGEAVLDGFRAEEHKERDGDRATFVDRGVRQDRFRGLRHEQPHAVAHFQTAMTLFLWGGIFLA